MKEEPPGILGPDERDLWRNFLSWSQSVVANVGRDLDEHSGLSVPDLEILGRLWDSGGGLDQQELLTWLRWSPSRLSHQLARMAKRGLLRRESAGSGRRMTVAITDEGEGQAIAAFTKLADSIRRHFFADLSEAEVAALRTIAARRR